MLPLNKSQIPALFKQARALEQAGKPAEAKTIYQNILSLDASVAPAYFQLGQIAFDGKDFERARTHLQSALKLAPKEPAIWQGLARVTSEIGDPSQIQAFLKQAKKARLDRKLLLALQKMFQSQSAKRVAALGSASPADVKHAIDLLQSGQHEKAVQAATKLHAAHPDVAMIADILANALAGTGQPDKAEQSFLTAQRLDPNYADTRCNYGRFLIERERYTDAQDQLRKALEIAPGMVAAMVAMGLAFRRNSENAKAIVAFRRALDADPKNAQAHLELGQVLVSQNDPESALEHLNKAAKLGADATESDVWKARALLEMGQESESLKIIERAQDVAPNDPEVLFTAASTHQRLGNFDRAHDLYRTAIAILPNAGRFYRGLVASEKLAADDPLIDQMKRSFYDDSLAKDTRINFGFALAKSLEDTKQFDKVFEFLKPANDWMHERQPFNFKVLQEQSRSLMKQMGAVDYSGLKVSGRSDYAPIFVTGLPRSGTTLVEQIICSHSTVTGGGELGFARRAWGDAMIGAKGVVRPWSEIDADKIAEIGHQVESQMRARFGEANPVTDKSVLSYSMVGPIRASLPNARFVIVKRDPRDNLLSMYKNIFADGTHLETYSLTDLARFYHLFQEFVDFWQRTTPDWFHVIQYEDLVANPEEETRKLIAACGLEWEDQCLNFHENKRRVDTLSVHQVRQPLYASSTKAWQRYQDDLGELFEALGPEYVPEK